MRMEIGRKVSGVGLAALLAIGCGGYDGLTDAEECPDCTGWDIEERNFDPGPAVDDENDGDIDEVEGAMVACAPEALDREATAWREVEEREWDGDRLLRRVEVTESHGVEERRVFEWGYDDSGRLTKATTVVDGELVGESIWTYDDDRPLEVERRLYGTAVERQRWHYENDRLVGRTLKMAYHGLDESLEFDQVPTMAPVSLAAKTVHVHDSYAMQSVERYQMNPAERQSPWVDANAHRHIDESKDCFALPASPGHGYPEDEASYHLGLTTDYGETAVAKTYDYGYGGYDPREWYGHVGIATSWPYQWYGQHERFDVDLTYDEEGRMVFEELEFQPGAEDEPVVVERKRHFDERGLELDSITVERDGDTSEAALRFARDVEGNLLFRERFHDGERVSFQDWHYEDGEAVRLDVYAEVVTAMWSPYVPNPGPDALLHDMESVTEHVVTYER